MTPLHQKKYQKKHPKKAQVSRVVVRVNPEERAWYEKHTEEYKSSKKKTEDYKIVEDCRPIVGP